VAEIELAQAQCATRVWSDGRYLLLDSFWAEVIDVRRMGP
jgi:hypothetical protein